jgi:hypothetical protein
MRGKCGQQDEAPNAGRRQQKRCDQDRIRRPKDRNRMWPKRERETNARSKIIPGENQEAGSDRARLNCNMRGRGLLRAHARPERIPRLIWHSSVPPRSLSCTVTLWQRMTTFLFVKPAHRLFSSDFHQKETAHKDAEETVSAAFRKAARLLRSGWLCIRELPRRLRSFYAGSKRQVSPPDYNAARDVAAGESVCFLRSNAREGTRTPKDFSTRS